jgi:hypothetical protein
MWNKFRLQIKSLFINSQILENQRESYAVYWIQFEQFLLIVALCMLLQLFLLFQVMHTFTHFKNTSSH